MTRELILGGGCFWCTEAVFLRVNGVKGVKSGYAGGHMSNPDYKSVCSGRTGHAEVVKISYDPTVISLSGLLDIFFHVHDPTTLNRQGHDEGTQYRSVVFFADEEEERIIKDKIREVNAEGAWGASVVTEVSPQAAFWPAEDYHQVYFDRNPSQPYCGAVIAPKIQKFMKQYAQKLSPRVSS